MFKIFNKRLEAVRGTEMSSNRRGVAGLALVTRGVSEIAMAEEMDSIGL
jgi:hypothetical protein